MAIRDLTQVLKKWWRAIEDTREQLSVPAPLLMPVFYNRDYFPSVVQSFENNTFLIIKLLGQGHGQGHGNVIISILPKGDAIRPHS
ncbi:MAG: hypothetical protein JXA30_18825 [Deltaproteobacteria bacterium]|nr:hypothetical protein [Deltaproteobacteria bacterium]